MANPYAPPRASVRDIAEQHATAVPADRATRLGAALLDSLIFSAMVYGPMFVGIVIAAAGASASGSSDDDAANTMLGLTALLLLAGFGVWLWLTIRTMKANGQSLGKKFCNIKVVRTDGSPVSVGRLIWLRNVVNMLISIIPLYGIVDVLFIFNEERRCLHDKMADTMVIKA